MVSHLIGLLFRINLPSHSPDPVIEVVADDAELPYLRGVANVRSNAGTVIVIAYAAVSYTHLTLPTICSV